MAAKKDTRTSKGRKSASRKEGQDSPPRAKRTILPRTLPERRDTKTEAVEVDFPVVGMGASAGGLEAFEQFFNNMPPDSGMAFVIVQHLDPTHKSILADLIKSYTRMEVTEVRDGMKVEPNTIYVIPPNADMAILHGHLHLMEPSAPRGLRQPIDYFFRTLSEDRKEKAICIVLSGTGTEGALGLREIKGQGGMVMVQDPTSAKYDGMPRSAIATGLSDYILAPGKMPEQLVAYVRHPFTKEPGKAPETEPDAANSLQKILILVRSRTGHDFSLYKQSTIIRRIERRIAIHEIATMPDYVRYLNKFPEESDILFKELLIGVTNFFRDPEAFEALKNKVFPALLEHKGTENTIVRAWVPGCSTGEEAYSIAMLLREYSDQTKQEIKIQIFATDIDAGAIETARSGVYPHGIAVDVTPERLRKFFTQQNGSYYVKKTIRDMVVFALQNVITDPPFSRLDLISCRNLLIYMGSELQKRVLPIFHYSLSRGGFLLLGTSESVGEFSDLFTPVDRKWKLFCRRDANAVGGIAVEIPALVRAAMLPTAAAPHVLRQRLQQTNQELAERTLLETYAASGILINEKADILYFHGNTGKFLHPTVGDAHFNVLAMASEGLKLELANAIRKAVTTKEPVRHDRVRVTVDGQDTFINVVVKPIWEPPSKRGLFMVMFEEIRSEETAQAAQVISRFEPGRADVKVKELEHELASTKEYLQTTIEELETSNEELKSTNEELQSANEELQSTNEELETSKEEQQSVNEELVTVNSELQQKIDALSKANDDMNNLLAATQIGTVFLDTNLNIQQFTPPVKSIINFIDSDVGRPVRHIVHNLEYEGLVKDIKDVLQTLTPKHVEVRTTEGNWYSMRVIPYRTVQNVIEGVVVTFVDITDRKQAESELLDSEQRYRQIGELVSAVWICDPDGSLTYLSKNFVELLGIEMEGWQGHKWIERTGLGSVKRLRTQWKQCAQAGGHWQHKFSIRDKFGKDREILARAVPVRDKKGQIISWVGINLDLSDASGDAGPCVTKSK
jgi:two-component system, chemotaxis family, CheB/CheR fusion protein